MRTTIFVVLSGLALFACSDGEGDLTLGDPAAEEAPPVDQQSAPKTCTELQKSYPGFSGSKLEVGRTDAPVGIDRVRMKPFATLSDDIKRVLGTTPTVLAESGPTFGLAADRWYVEPQPGAVALYQAYRVGFEGCLEFTKTNPAFASAPTAETATPQCRIMERKFWSRTPTNEEVQACVDVAARDSAMELQPGGTTTKATDPRRRWAYACASVVTAPGFLMY